jgi:hypothetical protein
MTADVGVFVENYKIVQTPMNNQIPEIFGGIFLRCTEDADILRLGRAAVRNVLVSPGTPQSFHNATYINSDEGSRKSQRILVD